MGSTVQIGRNIFDYGARFSTDTVLLFKISDQQHQANMYREGSVHEMCYEPNFGSIECTRLLFDHHLSKVEVYEELIYDILSYIPRRALDDVSYTTFTECTRTRQLQYLLQRWMDMPHDMRARRIKRVRIEFTVQTEFIANGCRLCSEHELFRVGGVETTLGGTFETRALPFDSLIESCQKLLIGLSAMFYGKNEQVSSVEILSTLTFICQAFGWRGRFTNRQLRQTWDWEAVARAAVQRMEDVDDDL